MISAMQLEKNFKELKRSTKKRSTNIEMLRNTKDVREECEGVQNKDTYASDMHQEFPQRYRRTRKRRQVTKHEKSSTMEAVNRESSTSIKVNHGRGQVLLRRRYDKDVMSLGVGRIS